MTTVNRRHLFAISGAGLAYASAAPVASALGQPWPSEMPSGATEPANDIQYADLPGVRLAYSRHGAGGRTPLVFVHGYSLRSTGGVYASLIRRLGAEFDVYALDLRGHGGSAASIEGWSQSAIADDVAAFTRALGLRNAVFAGHSLGGFTGLFAEIRNPGTFSALALLASAVAKGGTPPPGLKEAFMTRGREPAFAAAAFTPMYLRPEPSAIREAGDAVGLIDPAVHDVFFSNFARHVITDRLAEVRSPVLLINGARDTVVSPAEQHETAKGLPLSKEVIFSTEGHMLPLEAAEATAREMLTFFRHDAPALIASGALVDGRTS